MMRFTALDGLRGCCALMVVLFHSTYAGHLYPLPLVRNSYLFVDFFFVLSGFVISTAYVQRLGARIGPADFVLRRIGRLWPLHMAVLLAFIGNELLKILLSRWFPTENVPFTGDQSIATIISNIFLVQSLGIHDHLAWNSPSWSISVEFYTYMVFAGIVLTLPRFKIPLFGLISACGVLALSAWSSHAMNVTYDYGFFRCLYGFFLGCLVYPIYLKSHAFWQSRSGAMALLETLAFAAVLICLTWFAYGRYTLLTPLFFALVVYAFAHERGPLSRMLQTRLCQLLGLWSYAIYMVHFLLLILLQQVLKLVSKMLGFPLTADARIDAFGEVNKIYSFGGVWVMDGMTLFYVFLVIVAAALAHRWVEVPGQKFFNRLAARYQRPQVEAWNPPGAVPHV